MNLAQLLPIVRKAQSDFESAVSAAATTLDFAPVATEFEQNVETHYGRPFEIGDSLEANLCQGGYRGKLAPLSLRVVGLHDTVTVRTFEGPEVESFYQKLAQNAKERIESVHF